MSVDILKKYFPEASIPWVVEQIKAHNFHFRISKSRKTKLGDFRPAQRGEPAKISVNGDLGSFHFLITFTHEVAHAVNWKNYGRKVAPHGKEWKQTYQEMMYELIDQDLFPDSLKPHLLKHLSRPKASSCSDPDLYKVLSRFESKEEVTFLEDLKEGSYFQLNGSRLFIKGKKRRSRFECKHPKNGKVYLVSGHAIVEEITN